MYLKVTLISILMNKKIGRVSLMIKKYGDIISGITVLILAIATYLLTYTFKKITVTKIGSEFMPRLVAILLAVLAITVIYNGIKELKKYNKKVPEVSTDNVNVADKYSVIISFLLIAIYIALLDSLGFIIMTALYLFGQIYVLSKKEQRRLGLFAILSVVISSSVYFIFVYAFKLMLPSGILG